MQLGGRTERHWGQDLLHSCFCTALRAALLPRQHAGLMQTPSNHIQSGGSFLFHKVPPHKCASLLLLCVCDCLCSKGKQTIVKYTLRIRGN